MTTVKTVYEAFAAVMADVRAIEKGDRNAQQGFSFRGIDAVMQHVGPVLRKYGVIIIPTAEELKSEVYQTAKGTAMRNATVTMRYTVYGPGGDHFTGCTYGEAADSGDKAVTKAQSVAYRTFLLQALTVPTGDPDPDADSHERAARSPADEARARLMAVVKRKGLQPADIGRMFANDYGMSVAEADAATIDAFASIVNEDDFKVGA